MMSLFGGGESDRARSGDLQGFWVRWGLGLFALVAIGIALLVVVWTAGGGRVGDVLMSGGYEVGADGKFLRPKDAPVPVAPVKPEAMQHETPEGMEAFARYVVELVPYTWMSGDVSKLEAVCLPASSWCEDVIASTNKRVSAGGWVADAQIDVLAVSTAVEIPEHPHLWQIELRYIRPEMTTYDGVAVVTQKEDTGTLVLQARFEDSRWKLSAGGR